MAIFGSRISCKRWNNVVASYDSGGTLNGAYLTPLLRQCFSAKQPAAKHEGYGGQAGLDANLSMTRSAGIVEISRAKEDELVEAVAERPVHTLGLERRSLFLLMLFDLLLAVLLLIATVLLTGRAYLTVMSTYAELKNRGVVNVERFSAEYAEEYVKSGNDSFAPLWYMMRDSFEVLPLMLYSSCLVLLLNSILLFFLFRRLKGRNEG